jgi:hypothetical protein
LKSARSATGGSCQNELSVAIRFFVVGVTVAVAWLVLLTVTQGLSEASVVVVPMRISFPGMSIHWPGLPWQGATGGMIWVMFLVTTATNGVIYALIAGGISSLMKCLSPTTKKSN